MKIGALTVLLLAQDDTAAWIERLLSERIEDREEAARRLEDGGQAGVALLRRAARGPDAERAGRAAEILRRVEIRALVTPRMRQVSPDIELNLKSHASWAPAFAVVAQGGFDGEWYGFVPRRELVPFARRTLRAMSPDQADDTIRVIGRVGLRELAPELLDVCREGPSEGFMAASLALSSWGVEGVGEALRTRLKDPSSVVRVAALTAMEGSRPDTQAALIGAFRSDDPRMREEAARRTGLNNVHEAAPALAGLVGDRDAGVRIAALESLTRLKARAFAEAVAAALRDADPAVRTEAIRALIAFREEERLPDILRLLPATGDARPDLLKDFGKLGWRSAIPHLLQRIGDPEVAVKMAAIKALGELHAAEAVPALIALLPDRPLGDEAYAALRSIAPRDVVASLLPFLEHADDSAAERSLGLLTNGAEPAGLPRALELLDHPRRDVQIRAETLLAVLRPVRDAPRIARRLKHKDPDVGAAAVSILEDLPGSEVDAFIMGAAAPEDPVEVRTAALVALGRRRVTEALGLMETALTDASSLVRRSAIRGLQLLQPPGLSRYLLPRIQDADEEVGQAAVYALRGLTDKEWLPELRPLLRHDRTAVRSFSVSLLASHEAWDFLPDLLPLLTDPDPDLRKEAARVAARWGSDEAVPVLLALLDENDSDRHGIAALGAHGGAIVVRTVLERMKTAPYPRLYQAVRLLGESGSREAIAPLRRIFAKEDFYLKAAALEALNKIEEIPTEELQRIAGSDPASEVRDKAMEALCRRSPALSADLMAWLSEGLDRRRLEDALDAISALPPARAVPPCVQVLKDPRPAALRGALLILERFGDPSSAPAVRPLLKHPDPGVRRAAAACLDRTRDAGAAEGLVALMRDPYPEVRAATARAVGTCDVPQAVPGLIGLLQDPFEEVRTVAIHALGVMRASSAVPALMELLQSGDLAADYALESLLRMEATEAVPALTAIARNGRPWAASRAAAGLGWLGAPDAVAPLRGLLTSSPRLRTEAAVGLCFLGEIEGARALLEDGNPLPALNALRSPDTFRKLRSVEVPSASRQSRRAFLAYAAREAGLAFSVFDPSTPYEAEWLEGSLHGPYSWNSFFFDNDLTASVVLDADRLHVVDAQRARQMHQCWWDARK